MRYFVSEVFDQIEAAQTVEEREKIMVREKTNQDFIGTLINVFDPDIEFLIKEIPPYKPLKGSVDYGAMNYNEALRKSYLFIKGDNRASPNLTLEKRKVLLIQMLEALSEQEAAVYANMILKKTGSKKLNEKLVRKVFPYLLPEKKEKV